MKTSIARLLPVLVAASVCLLSPGAQADDPVLNTAKATFAGVKFKESGAKVIQALSFPDSDSKNAALASFAEFMTPPRKKENLAVRVPGMRNVILRFNAYTGQFAQLEVSSEGVKTSEGVGVGSQFQDFVSAYGDPKYHEYPNGAVTYSFETQNPALKIVLRTNTSPVKYYMAAFDLRMD